MNLLEWIESYNKLSNKYIFCNKLHGKPSNILCHVARELLFGLQDLQYCKYIHRDIKPENIMVQTPKDWIIPINQKQWKYQALRTRVINCLIVIVLLLLFSFSFVI
jgi:serine/threonine protein kinase